MESRNSAQKHDPANEEVAIVDPNDVLIGSASRREMRRRNLIHRASYIIVLDRQGRLFVQKRSMGKDVYPGLLDVAAGGVVLAGESYEVSAERELAEELGISGVALEPVLDQYHEDEGNRVWGRIFLCRSEGPFVLQAEEVDDGFFMTVDQVLAPHGRHLFTPDGLAVVERLVADGVLASAGAQPED